MSMCWTKVGKHWVFGSSVWPSTICTVCGGDLEHPPTRSEWLDEMEENGYVRDSTKYIR